MRRRLIASLAIGSILVGVIGCAPDSSAGEEVVVRLWDQQVATSYETSFEAFEREHPEIQVTVEVVPWADYWRRLRSDIASGSEPDVFWTNAANFRDYAEAGRLLDITATLGREAETGWSRAVVDQYTVDGVLWGVPQLTDPAIAILVNEQLLSAAGMTPGDLDDLAWDPAADSDTLRTVAAQLTVDAAGRSALDAGFDATRVEQWGFSASNDLNAILLPFLGSAGAAWQEGDRFVFDSPTGIATMAYLVDLINRWHVAPPASVTNPPAGGDAALELFLRGRLALFQTGAYNLANVRDGAEFPWRVVELPRGPVGTISVTNGVIAAGSSDSQRPEAQRAVLEWLGSGPGQLEVGASGAALPAALDAQPAYFDYWAGRGVDISPMLTVLDNGVVQAPQGARYAAAQDAYQPILNDLFLGRRPVPEGTREAARAANAAMDPG
jgi:multiple sugar transport system substrate-binding protein